MKEALNLELIEDENKQTSHLRNWVEKNMECHKHKYFGLKKHHLSPTPKLHILQPITCQQLTAKNQEEKRG